MPNSWRSVKSLPTYGCLMVFKMAVIHHRGIVVHVFGHQQIAFGGRYHCAKFG